jgi:hypothetical protein
MQGGTMATRRLKALAREYWRVRRLQEQDHTDPALDWQRTEAHDRLLLQMDREGIAYSDREEAAQIAREIVEGTFAGPATRRKSKREKLIDDGQMDF